MGKYEFDKHMHRLEQAELLETLLRGSGEMVRLPTIDKRIATSIAYPSHHFVKVLDKVPSIIYQAASLALEVPQQCLD